jgi:hypothetical protein
MFPLLFVGLFSTLGTLFSIGLAIGAKAARTAVVVASVAMATGVLALGLGTIGKIDSERGAMKAIGNVGPADRAVIAAAGLEESRAVWALGAWLGLPALLAGSGCLAISGRRLFRAETK